MAVENSKAVWPGWETVGLIGRGSFGAVYEIQREIFDEVEKAALKVITIPQNASDIDEMYSDGFDEESITSTFKNYLKSIVAEYSLMRRMNGCTNIVNCDDVRYVQHDDGIGWDIFIKMELLKPLTKALPSDIPEETVIQLARDICTALQLCKKHDIVHRDIKPQNIFVSPNGDYKLGDFGIAKTVEKTMGGTKIGTYKYMAPEVYNNQPYGSTADIYSLGLVLYWLLNERRMPFMPLPPAKLTAGDTENSRNRRLAGEAFPDPKNGSKALKAIVMKACAYDVKERYASADEMLADLNRLGQEEKAVMQMPVVPVLPKQAPVEDEDKTVAVFRRSDVQESATPAAPVVIKASVPVPAPTEANAVSESPKKSEAVPQVDNKEDTSPKPKQSKKKWPMILGAAAVLLIAVLAFLLPGKDNGTEDELPSIQNQENLSEQAQETTPATEAQGNTEAVAQTEAPRNLPEGTVLIERSWKNGDLVVVALDDHTLWLQILDNRPDQQYEDLGSPWEITFDFGEKFWYGDGEYEFCYPYEIGVRSPADSALFAYEIEQGNTQGYLTAEMAKSLWFGKAETYSSGGWGHSKSVYTNLDIEKEGNLYAATIILPEWFEVAAHKDLVKVDVRINEMSHWRQFCRYGSSSAFKSYEFATIKEADVEEQDRALEATGPKTSEEDAPAYAAWSGWVTELPSDVDADHYEIQEKTQYSSIKIASWHTLSDGMVGISAYDIYDRTEFSTDYGDWSEWYAEGEKPVWGSLIPGNFCYSQEEERQDAIQYRYRDYIAGEGGYGNWSSWQFESVAGSDTRQVETRAVFRVRMVTVYSTRYYYKTEGTWTEFSDTPVVKDEKTAVRTRVVYRYRKIV